MAAEPQTEYPRFEERLLKFLEQCGRDLVDMPKEVRRMYADAARALAKEAEQYGEFHHRGRRQDVPLSEAANVARKLGTFKSAEAAALLHLSRARVRHLLVQLEEAGIVTPHDPGMVRTDRRYRWDYVPPQHSGELPAKRPPVELEAVQAFREERKDQQVRRGAPVALGRDVPAIIRDQRTRDLLKACIAQGCTVGMTGSGHVKVVTPAEGSCYLPSTPSDHRSVLNGRAKLRQLGVHV